jgi:hypothetical protein
MIRLTVRLFSAASPSIAVASLMRSFRVEQVAPLAPTDVLLARQEQESFFSYLSYRGEPREAVANLLLSVADADRTFHVVFGRENIPCDFFADLDLPTVELDKAERIVTEVVQCLELRLKSFAPKRYEHLLLHSPSATKTSFHLHTRCDGALFQDYRTVRTLAEEINKDLMKNVIDTAVYRPWGTLRTAFSSKPAALEGDGGMFRPYVPRSAFLLSALTRDLSSPEVLSRSFCLRGGKVPSGVSIIKPKELLSISDERKTQTGKGSRTGDVDEHGNPVSRFMSDSAKWRRYNSAVLKLRKLPAKASIDFGTWVRTGLALHNFSPDEAQFEEWVRFSLKCPQKFSREACVKKWAQFERNPDKANWRRGYNYLTVTIWRHLGQ